MLAIYQITAFYLILFLEASFIIGYYPKMQPDTFSSLRIYSTHPSFHLDLASACFILLILSQVLGLGLTIFYKSYVEKKFLESSKTLGSLREVRQRFKVALVFFLLGIGSAARAYILITHPVEGNWEFPGAALIFMLALTAIFLVISGWGMESVYRSKQAIDRELKLLPKPEKFIWDHHAKIYSFALKLLFLGVNVWWPYLVLRYGLGLKLNALYFLPVHLAGVLPFSFLKRRHKFKRTIHPGFTGRIKHRERYEALSATS